MHPLIEKLGSKEVIRRCLGSGYRDMKAFLFTAKFIYIPHKRDRSNVCLDDVITHLQIEVIESILSNQYTYVLKSRKEGISTIYAAWNFRHIWLVENFESLILSLDDESASYIKSIYQYMHDHLPLEIQGNQITRSRTEMKFDTGGHLRSMTASTDASRGSTPRSIHGSEFAQYTDIKRTLDAAFNAATDDCEIVLESTAKGMNLAYDMWNNEDNVYNKVFITWMNSPNCLQDRCIGKTPQELLDAQQLHGFSDKHLYWATDRYHARCGSNWDSFCQEYPMVAEDAFIASGSRYFTGIIFPGVKFDEKRDTGFIEFLPPRPYVRYVLGADTATGSPTGDFSAFTILDCTKRYDPKIAATFYKRLAAPDYVEQLHKYLSRYNDPLAVIEINGPGLEILTRLREMGYTHLYRRRIEDKITGRLIEKLGWLTTEASRYILFAKLLAHARGGQWAGYTLEKINFICKRMQYEVNSVIYNNRGKIVHAPSKHDDLVISCGLALQGMSQSFEDEPVVARVRPRSVREVMMFEAETGLLMEDLGHDYFDDYDPQIEMDEEAFPVSPGQL